MAAFGATAMMLAGDLFQADLYAAMRTFAVNMRLTVFPFVFLKQERFAKRAGKFQKFLVFRHTLGDVFGKHAIKNEKEQKPREDTQKDGGDRLLYEKQDDGKRKI